MPPSRKRARCTHLHRTRTSARARSSTPNPNFPRKSHLVHERKEALWCLARICIKPRPSAPRRCLGMRGGLSGRRSSKRKRTLLLREFRAQKVPFWTHPLPPRARRHPSRRGGTTTAGSATTLLARGGSRSGRCSCSAKSASPRAWPQAMPPTTIPGWITKNNSKSGLPTHPTTAGAFRITGTTQAARSGPGSTVRRAPGGAVAARTPIARSRTRRTPLQATRE
mmetsp:Transcript_5587/g.9639  ORF Transcript_5587/g.9639 Transcript_5587/m.9639 type:complete len:224 (-) Transcript_5587:343-1014(-)